MSKLGFPSFCKLIEKVEQHQLFDAVKPELQSFADHYHSDKKKGDAYKEIFALAHEACTEKRVELIRDFEKDIVGRMGKGRDNKGTNYRAARIHAERLYFFFLSEEHCPDPSYGKAINNKLFKQSFFDEFETELRNLGISRPSYLAPSQIVHLGPITISLGYDVNLVPLSLREPKDTDLLRDGKPDIFKALNWKTRLSSPHGRTANYESLLNWALDKDTKMAKLMLVSGPGGSGKTRLVADVVSELVNKHDWRGGFLPSGVTEGYRLEGGGKGVALIIDYPEERIEFVKKILAAITDDTEYDRPIRIILASRENLENWKESLNNPNPNRFKELILGSTAYLETKDALNIIEDVRNNYSERIGISKPKFVLAEEWLHQHYSHRLPLMAIAAAVHAVHEPKKAFTLSGKGILNALAQKELQRVRGYSQHVLGDKKVLEKLLALSTITKDGLSKDMIYSLGDMGICQNRSGAALLEGIKQTPFWHKDSTNQISHLQRLQPDRVAVAFTIIALDLEDQSPALSKWLQIVASYGDSSFANILARISMDMGIISRVASEAIEMSAVTMLRSNPELISKFKHLSEEAPPTFSARLTIEICQCLIEVETNSEKLAILHNTAATSNSLLREHKESLYHSKLAVKFFQKLARKEPEKYTPQLATSFTNLSAALSDLGRDDEALKTANEAVSIFHGRLNQPTYEVISAYAFSLNRLANRLSDVNFYEEALTIAQRAVEVELSLTKHNDTKRSSSLASYLITLANRYNNLAYHKQAVEAIARSEAIYQKLAENSPEFHLGDWALSLTTYANFLIPLGKYEEAHQKALQAVGVYQYLAAGRVDAFQPDMALALTILSQTQTQLMQLNEAIIAQKNANEIYRELCHKIPRTYMLELACGVRNLATLLSRTGELKEALSFGKEAVEIFRILTKENSEIHSDGLAMSLNNLANRYSDNGLYQKALSTAEESVELYKKIETDGQQVKKADIAMSLCTLANRLGQLDHMEEAIIHREEAISIYESLASNGMVGPSMLLASETSNLANSLIELERFGEAEKYAENAVYIYRKIVTTTKKYQQPQTAFALYALSKIHNYRGRNSEAHDTAHEALIGMMPLVKIYPDRYKVIFENIHSHYIGICEVANIAPDQKFTFKSDL